MKCVCIQKCQVRQDTRAVLVAPGKVLEFDKCPPHFEEIKDDSAVDFINDSEETLMAKKWHFSDAAAVIKEAYNVELKRLDKPDVVAAIIDARYRALD